MSDEAIPIYLRFPDRATALAVGAAPIGVSDIEQLAADGWYGGTYWCIDDIGALYAPTGDFDESGVPVLEALPGYHVNGLWCGAEDDLPAELSAFRVYPEMPLRVWG